MNQQTIQNLIIKSEIKEALDLLYNNLNEISQNQIILLYGRYNRNETDLGIGIIRKEDYNFFLRRIVRKIKF